MRKGSRKTASKRNSRVRDEDFIREVYASPARRQEGSCPCQPSRSTEMFRQRYREQVQEQEQEQDQDQWQTRIALCNCESLCGLASCAGQRSIFNRLQIHPPTATRPIAHVSFRGYPRGKKHWFWPDSKLRISQHRVLAGVNPPVPPSGSRMYYPHTMDRRQLESRLRMDHGLDTVRNILGEIRCWVVGGYIRDLALEREASDLDLVVREDGREAAGRLAKRFGLRAHQLGRPGRQCWLVAGADSRPLGPGISKIEIWPLGGLSLEEDILRRDFSINAMLWAMPDGPLLDLVGGLDDLREGRLRAIDRNNLVEDPLRLLRAPRLLGSLAGFELEARTRQWIRQLAPSLPSVAPARIGAELFRICSGPDAFRGLQTAADLGLLRALSARENGGTDLAMRALEVLDRAQPVPEAARQPETLLAWLLVLLHIESASSLAAFCWPKRDGRIALAAARKLDAARSLVRQDWRNRREAIFHWGGAFPASLGLAAAMDLAEGGDPSAWRGWWRQYRYFQKHPPPAQLLLSVQEISRLSGIPPGPELGRVITELRRKIIRREILSAASAEAWLRNFDPEQRNPAES